MTKNDGAPQADGRVHRSLIESLLYLTTTHLDIMLIVNYLSRLMQSPSQIHFVAVKRVLRYLKETVECGMNFVKTNTTNLIGFLYSDWEKSDEEMMSTSGFCFSMGGTFFSWNSKKESGGSLHYRSRIHSCICSNKPINLTEENIGGIKLQTN